MLKITLEQWRMFLAVVEYGGFNQASVGVHKSQSSIHSAVNKIEHALGVKLFSIEGRKTTLTQAGELMLRRANYLLEEAEKVEAIGLNLGEGIETKLRIAVDEIFPPHLIYKVCDAVSKEFPVLRIELMESVLSGSTELLKNSEVDIAIAPYPVSGLFSEELCEIDFLAVASPTHPLNTAEGERTFEDLKSHRQIVVRDSSLSAKKDAGWLGAEQRWTVTHIRTSVDMIVNGFGFAWLPVPLIENQLQENKLQAIKLSMNSRRKAKLHLLFNDADSLGPAARAFLGELRYLCLNELG
ncbi:LysR family transcriptional regulator [Alteromonas sp. KUL49]|uniref:LysR family transcriptional regulator n=1 Tax=Alteromonas sp. KUL49 TaxID=2480798 RepID=UPI00102EE4E2|nr:LysR family transcriptional regulator [Alteromonas sp. KUL49]TAP41494.1 LysR family transcriptional regulator [Alteromonas sp. KUL49]GEA10585.1 LysR family transcriptional regulator [Alteromonas sp. KUL49]